MLDAMAREFGARDAVALEGETGDVRRQLRAGAPLEPEFQDFLGKLDQEDRQGREVGRQGGGEGHRDARRSGRCSTDQGAGQAAAQPGAAEGDRQAAGRGPADGAQARRAAGTRAEAAGAQCVPPAMRRPEPGMDAGQCGARHQTPALDPAAPGRGRPCKRGRSRGAGDAARVRSAKWPRRCFESDESAFELELARTRASSNGQARVPYSRISIRRAQQFDVRAREPQGRGEPGAVRRELPSRGIAGRQRSRCA